MVDISLILTTSFIIIVYKNPELPRITKISQMLYDPYQNNDQNKRFQGSHHLFFRECNETRRT